MKKIYPAMFLLQRRNLHNWGIIVIMFKTKCLISIHVKSFTASSSSSLHFSTPTALSPLHLSLLAVKHPWLLSSKWHVFIKKDSLNAHSHLTNNTDTNQDVITHTHTLSLSHTHTHTQAHTHRAGASSFFQWTKMGSVLMTAFVHTRRVNHVLH